MCNGEVDGLDGLSCLDDVPGTLLWMQVMPETIPSIQTCWIRIAWRAMYLAMPCCASGWSKISLLDGPGACTRLAWWPIINMALHSPRFARFPPLSRGTERLVEICGDPWSSAVLAASAPTCCAKGRLYKVPQLWLRRRDNWMVQSCALLTFADQSTRSNRTR